MTFHYIKMLGFSYFLNNTEEFSFQYWELYFLTGCRAISTQVVSAIPSHY